MAKAVKKAKPKKERPAKYDEKLAVNGSFLDIMKAAAKHAQNNSAKKSS
ncbi:MAG TPA: hypothetical protein VK705_05725 [Ferruginibacter sp.]|jgi:hypothetical protein|nr:hypothetical protein [Ferruginibacter sp.]